MDVINTSLLCRCACFLLLVLFLHVQVCDSGECCRSHYDRIGLRRHDIWCRDYCCEQQSRYSFKLYCCSDPLRRASYGLRDDFCAAWFVHPSNLWVPILIGIIVLAILIGLCGCCFCFCF